MSSTNGAVVKRRELPVRVRDEEHYGGESTQIYQPTPVLYPAKPIAARREDQAHKDVWDFFVEEYDAARHPTSDHGRKILKSLADCLADIAPRRYGTLKVDYSRTGPSNHRRDNTIAHELEQCRILCTNTLGSLETDMLNIRGKAWRLWGLDGQIMRALCCYTKSTENDDKVVRCLDRLQTSHNEIISQLTVIDDRWQHFQSYVCQLKSTLSEQDTNLERRRKDVQARRGITLKKLAARQAERDDFRSKLETDHLGLQTIRDRINELQETTDDADGETEKLNANLAKKQLELAQLERKFNSKPVDFKLAKDREMKRREDRNQASWSGWAWNAFWHPMEEWSQWTDRSAWDKLEQQHKNWDAASNRKWLRLRNDIEHLSDKIEAQELRKQHLRGDDVEQELERLRSKERETDGKFIGKDRELEGLEDEVNELRRSAAADQALLGDLDAFHQIVPGLCADLREVDLSIGFSRNKYQALLERYQGHSTLVFDLASRMKNPELSKDELNMLCNDVIRLCIVYLILAVMAGHSSTVSKHLYQEALRHIAPLGTVPTGSTKVLGRLIRADDPEHAHEDIYRLEGEAEKMGKMFDQAQNNDMSGVWACVEDIIKVVDEIRPKDEKPPKDRSRFWRRKSGRAHELPGDSVGNIS